VAFVLGFSRNWKADWGGLTLFYDDGGNVTGAFVPAFNSLTMFRVPVYHSVTYVTPFAREVRYSITGWLLA
jgi:SM-20-related protein